MLPQLNVIDQGRFSDRVQRIIVNLLIFFSFSGFSSNAYSATYTANGSGAWESTTVWASAPNAATLAGTISSGSVEVSGTIVRTGDLSVGNTLYVTGKLTVNGSVSGNNPITVASGATLYITGNLVSSGLTITVESGGTLMVGGSTTLNGGNMTIRGNFITLGSFNMTSILASLNNTGNIVIGGNFNFSNGSFSLTTPVDNKFYLINSDPSITVPSWYTNICTTSGQTCNYGDASDLISNDPGLADYINSLIGCILTQPLAAYNVCTGSSVSISIITYGLGLSYQWQYSSDGSTWNNVPLSSVYSGNTTATLTISPTTVMAGYRFRCVVSGTCSAISNVASLSVYSPPSITAQPSSSCGYNTDATFSVVAAGASLSYQWQKSTDGSAFSNIAEVWGYSATTTATLQVSAFRESSTTYYRCIVSSNGCPSYSNIAVLTTLGPSAPGTITGTSSVCQGTLDVAYSVPLIAGAATYVWEFSGTGAIISGNTQSVTITFLSSATSGNLTVYGVNACGEGVKSENYEISVNSVSSTGAVYRLPNN